MRTKKMNKPITIEESKIKAELNSFVLAVLADGYTPAILNNFTARIVEDIALSRKSWEAELREKIEGMKKKDLDLSPGFVVTAEYCLGELRGGNNKIGEILFLLSPGEKGQNE
jgi:hypothetical protein